MNKSQFQMLARFLANKINIKCVPRKNLYNWAVDGDGQTIYYPDTIYYSDKDFGLLIHEAAHIRFSNFDESFKEVVQTIGKTTGKGWEQIFSLINALEDPRVEKKIGELYKGAKMYFKNTYQEIWEEKEFSFVYDYQLIEKMQKRASKDQWVHYCAAVCFGMTPELGKQYGDDYLSLLGNIIFKETQEAYDKTFPIIESKLFKCQNTKKVLELVQKEIFPYYLPLCLDRNDKKENEDELKRLIQFLRKEFGKYLLKIKQQKKGKQIKEKQQIDGSKEGGSKKNGLREFGEMAIEVLTKNLEKYEKKEEWQSPKELTEEKLQHVVNAYLPRVRKAISILKDSDFDRWEGNYRSGRLESKKLFRLKTKQFKVFSRKIAIDKSDKDLVVGLLIDESGSMNAKMLCDDKLISPDSDKVERAQLSCIFGSLIAKALELCNKTSIVMGFNLVTTIHKKFNRKINYEELLNINKNVYSFNNSNTKEALGVRKIHQLLMQQPQKKKILIVLCDGEPDGSENLEQTLKIVEKDLTIYGVGIGKDLSRYYKNSIEVSTGEELVQYLINIFKKHVGKRIR